MGEQVGPCINKGLVEQRCGRELDCYFFIVFLLEALFPLHAETLVTFIFNFLSSARSLWRRRAPKLFCRRAYAVWQLNICQKVTANVFLFLCAWVIKEEGIREELKIVFVWGFQKKIARSKHLDKAARGKTALHEQQASKQHDDKTTRDKIARVKTPRRQNSMTTKQRRAK